MDFNQGYSFLSEQLRLPLDPEQMEEAREEFDRYSSICSGSNAYINRLCLDIWISWLRQFVLEKPRPDTDLLICWEFLNGTAINFGLTRVVLIPYEIPQNEAFIPREWIDIPRLVADYYLLCRVSLDGEESWICPKGYVSHSQVKIYGQYDPEQRCYYTNLKSLKTEEDIFMFLAAIKFGPRSPRAETSPLPTLDRQRAEVLLNQLSNTDIIDPRLQIPFAEWAALLANNQWRRKLYELRTFQSAAASLLENLVRAGWQTADEIYKVLSAQRQTFAVGVRETNYAGEINIENADSARIGKFVDFGTQISSLSVLLMMTLMPDNGETNLLLQVFPTGDERYVPTNLQLLVLEENGETFLKATSQSYDDYIQLMFSAEDGECCTVKLILSSAIFSEKLTF